MAANTVTVRRRAAAVQRRAFRMVTDAASEAIYGGGGEREAKGMVPVVVRACPWGDNFVM